MDAASGDLANARLSPGKKARAMRLAMGFQRTKEAIRGVGAARISVAAQRAIRYPRAKDIPIMWRAWLRRMRFAPPELSAADPKKWRNLIATAGLSGKVSGGPIIIPQGGATFFKLFMNSSVTGFSFVFFLG